MMSRENEIFNCLEKIKDIEELIEFVGKSSKEYGYLKSSYEGIYCNGLVRRKKNVPIDPELFLEILQALLKQKRNWLIDEGII